MGLAGTLFAGYFLGDGPRRSLTYGQLPSEAELEKHFDAHVDFGFYNYAFRGSDAKVAGKAGIDLYGSVKFSGFMKMLRKLMQRYEHDSDDKAGELASTLLETIGVEWI